MNSLQRGLLALAIGSVCAYAGDTDRQALEAAKKRPTASSRLHHLLPLVESRDDDVKKEATDLIAAMPAADKEKPLVEELRNNQTDSLRAVAAKDLEGIKGEEPTKALVRAVLFDPIADVRHAATESLKKNVDQTELVHAFYSAFFLHDPCARIRAAEAIGKVGATSPAAVETLIQELWITWGATQRVNVFFATQMAYVKSFTVEVATSAVIAKPIVGTVSDGVVLDTTVLRVQEKMITIERRVIGDALKGLTGQDYGDDVKAWDKWWQQHKDDFAGK